MRSRATGESGDRPNRVRLRVLRRPLVVWVLMAILAVLNGGFRETVLVSRFGHRVAHLLSTALLVAVILLVAYGFFRSTSTDYRPKELVAVGVCWTVLTVGFEFLVGYVEGTPVSVTLGQYDVFAGQVWIVVPVTLLVAPMLFGHVLRRR
ncbi:hypothetical protein DQW50_15530 [Halorubrum sp. 48-1-W]|uniref:hypothetical protein n=1 Tax=Halorubrum sp. 48-1-W TaxID=2249761 RepID=UPI000DCBA8EF|nr:hypothetical protein [Halorubrum sp. 48-1-W]RAW44246.1 hypothetical protein DQW50_15530 [Halorubrum sp. 48-1-W]